MSITENELFLQLSIESDTRVLHPCTLVESDEATFTAEVDDGELKLDVGLTLIAFFYNRRREFVKQSVCVESLEKMDRDEHAQAKLRFRLERSGHCRSAEKRECYRVSTATDRYMVEFGERSDCHVVNMSPNGFAVISDEVFEPGDIVRVKTRLDNCSCIGHVRIQNVRVMEDGQFCYGVQCIDRELEPSLQKCSMDVQREQLRRLAVRT